MPVAFHAMGVSPRTSSKVQRRLESRARYHSVRPGELSSLKVPFVVSWGRAGHFVVVESVLRDGYRLNDPARGNVVPLWKNSEETSAAQR